MSKHSILDEIPEVVRDKVQRALRNIARLSDEKQGYKRLGMGERFDEELDATMAPDQEALDEFRRICARKGINADAVIALLSKDNQLGSQYLLLNQEYCMNVYEIITADLVLGRTSKAASDMAEDEHGDAAQVAEGGWS
jgi:hypothetical protein